MKKSSKTNKSSYLSKLENVNNPIYSLSNSSNLESSNSLLNSLDVSYVEELNNIKAMLQVIEVVKEEELKAYWSMVMLDKNTSVKDKLTASKLLAQSYGMMDKGGKAVASVGGAVYKWKTTTVDAEIVPVEKTEQGKEEQGNTLGAKEEVKDKEV